MLFENALAGLYKLAAVDLVREQLQAAMGADLPYDIADEGLLVWPGPGYETEVTYHLRGGHVAEPQIVRGHLEQPLPTLNVSAMLFRNQDLEWTDWVALW